MPKVEKSSEEAKGTNKVLWKRLGKQMKFANGIRFFFALSFSFWFFLFFFFFFFFLFALLFFFLLVFLFFWFFSFRFSFFRPLILTEQRQEQGQGQGWERKRRSQQCYFQVLRNTYICRSDRPYVLSSVTPSNFRRSPSALKHRVASNGSYLHCHWIVSYFCEHFREHFVFYWVSPILSLTSASPFVLSSYCRSSSLNMWLTLKIQRIFEKWCLQNLFLPFRPSYFLF